VDIARSKSSIDTAAAALRDISLAKPDGAFVGSEDELVEKIGFSRPTVRQAARLLEREGVLRVRRGINGGYFAARPTGEMVESVVCAYLDRLGLDARHTDVVSTALWVEVARLAAGAERATARAFAERFAQKIEQLDSDATIEDVAEVERESRSATFDLIGGGYIELIFRINAAFSRQQERGQVEVPFDLESHRRFVRRWKKAKLMELEAIADGDATLAMMAATQNRKLWMGRGHQREGRLTDSPN
jgi:GntR family transcriptional regulator, transcriptional repressor for pyruvate dehydrogenase complex